MLDPLQILLAESFIDMFLEHVDLKQLVRDVYAHERQTVTPIAGSAVASVSPLGLQASKLPATTTQVRKAPAGLWLSEHGECITENLITQPLNSYPYMIGRRHP